MNSSPFIIKRNCSIRLILLTVPFFLHLISAPYILAQSPVADALNSNGLCDTTIWAAYSNPANLTNAEKSQVAASVRNHYFHPALNSYFSSAVIPAGKSIVVADIAYQGVTYWSQKSGGVGVAHNLGAKFSLAGKISAYHISHADVFTSHSAVSPELFMRLSPTDQFQCYAAINAFPLFYDDKIQIADRSFLQMASRYGFSDQFTATIELSSNTEAELQPVVSVQYNYKQIVTIMGGVSPGETPLAGGINYHGNKWGTVISAQFHKVLGLSTSAGVSLVLF